MDKIIKVTVGAFVIILVGFISIILLNAYIDNEYTSSLSGTYAYETTITTDSLLSNVTLFIPVPEDRDGNSPIIANLSAGTVAGIPAGWTSTLFGTGKSTLVKITVPVITPPEGTTPEKPFSVTFSVNTSQKDHIETMDPIGKGISFRPVYYPREETCPPVSPASTGKELCNSFETTIYADYLSSPNSSVKISSDLTGKNSWMVFGPHSNEYRAGITVTLSGENHGWTTAKGYLTTGIGMYDEPQITP
jgi:hypothetical protein